MQFSGKCMAVAAGALPLFMDAVPLFMDAVPLFMDAESLFMDAMRLFLNDVRLVMDSAPLFMDALPLFMDAVPLFMYTVPLCMDARGLVLADVLLFMHVVQWSMAVLPPAAVYSSNADTFAYNGGGSTGVGRSTSAARTGPRRRLLPTGTLLRPCCIVSGTDCAISYARVRYWLRYLLRPGYAMSGTEMRE
eukprot:1806296-Rhodomonas_salina.2